MSIISPPLCTVKAGGRKDVNFPFKRYDEKRTVYLDGMPKKMRIFNRNLANLPNEE